MHESALGSQELYYAIHNEARVEL